MKPMETPVQIVIFGASGDLTAKKLVPALASLARKGEPPAGFTLIGVARREKSDDQFRQDLRAQQPAEGLADFDGFAPRIHYFSGDVRKPEDIRRLGERLDALPGGATAGRLFYFSLMPDLFAPAVSHLAQAGLLEQSGPCGPWRRVVVEKPFGHDLPSARALNQTLQASLREEQIYRIDHYLGKETVQNLFAFRFNNTIFEPVWNRRHVELVQITVAESGGVEPGRVGYYDASGAMSDVLQNHMLQILAMVAMEPPSSLDPEEVRGQKVSVLKSLRFHGAAGHSVRARYGAGTVDGKPVAGYLQEGAAADSSTETFVAIRAEIENWRWSGVPFLLRHGKRLKQRFTEVKVQFRVPPIQLADNILNDDGNGEQPPVSLPDGTVCDLRPNVLTLSIQPRESLSLSFSVKAPGNGMVMVPAHLGFDYRDRFGEITTPAYERLLLDAIQGDPSLFLRSDEVEASWRFTDAVRASWTGPDAPPVLDYAPGGWGPTEADALFHGCEGGWSRG
jgi:glucose-6-phosphate 1-dehydrogenase